MKTGVNNHKPRNNQKLGDRSGTDPSLALQRQHNPTDTWISNFWLPESREN